MNIKQYLDTTNDPSVEDAMNVAKQYVKQHPTFVGENYITLVGLDVFDLLHTTYTEPEKTRKIQEISANPLGKRRMLLASLLHTYYLLEGGKN